MQTETDLPLVVGVDLGGTQIRAAVLRGSRLLSRIGKLTGENPQPDLVIPRMLDAVYQAIADAGVSFDEIAGIGVGAPGPLNGRTGIVYCPPNLIGWKDVPLRNIFQEQFHLPIFLENDANAAALGESMFGAGRGCEDVVYLTISTGIGGGVISNGEIMSGAIGTAAELGHMSIDWRGPRCNCGHVGCLESLASGTAIARRANEMIVLGSAEGNALLEFVLSHQQQDDTSNTPRDRLRHTPIHVNARMVAMAAEAGVPIAKSIIATAAEALGVGLVNIIHLFNPEVIILGGGVIQIGDPLLAPAKRIVSERAMQVPRDHTRIALAELGNDAGLVGAGALVYYNHQEARLQVYAS